MPRKVNLKVYRYKRRNLWREMYRQNGIPWHEFNRRIVDFKTYDQIAANVEARRAQHDQPPK